MRISGKNMSFGDKKIKKSNFYKNKRLFKISDIDANKVVVSKKKNHMTQKSFKYIIGYNDIMSLEHYVVSSNDWVC